MKLFWGFIFCSFSFLFSGEEYRNKVFTNSDNFSKESFYLEDFSYSNFNGLSFSESEATLCDFFKTSCLGTRFKKTILNGSDFRFAFCKKACFKKSKLVKVWLWDGDFLGADFTNANLEKAIVFDWKIGFEGDEKTIVQGANFKDVWGLTNRQKEYLRENGAVNVPEDCDEEEERIRFKKQMDKIQEELSILYPFNKWAKNSFSFFIRLVTFPFRACLKN